MLNFALFPLRNVGNIPNVYLYVVTVHKNNYLIPVKNKTKIRRGYVNIGQQSSVDPPQTVHMMVKSRLTCLLTLLLFFSR